MKKLFSTFCFIFLISLLTGCGLRERLLATPDEYTIPDDSLIAECVKDEVSYTFIYKDDGVYQYSIDGVVQSEEVLDTILEQAYLHDSSVEKYLQAEFPGVCTIEEFIE